MTVQEMKELPVLTVLIKATENGFNLKRANKLWNMYHEGGITETFIKVKVYRFLKDKGLIE